MSDNNYTRLSITVDQKKKLNLTCFKVGIAAIVMLSCICAFLRYFMNPWELVTESEELFDKLLAALVVAEAIISAICFYAIYLLFQAIVIMRSQAKKIGNSEGVKDVCNIMIILVFLTLSAMTYTVTYSILGILRYYRVGPFVHGSHQRLAWICVFDIPITVMIVISDLCLIKIFWSYVINVN